MDIGRERCEVITSERKEEQFDVSLKKKQSDNSPKVELSEEYRDPIVGKDSKCETIAD